MAGATSEASPGEPRCHPQRRIRPDGDALRAEPDRAICISGMSARRSKAGGRRGAPAGAFCCASRISTGPAAAPNIAAAILEDLAWLGLDWDGPVRRQSRAFRRLPRGARPARGAGAALPVLLHAARDPGRDRRAPAAPRMASWDRSILAPAAASAPRNAPRGARGRRLRVAARSRLRALRADRPARLVRGRAPRGEPTRRARRRRAGPQGDAGELPSRGHGRRRDAGRDPGDPRRGSVRRRPTSTGCCRRCSACRRRATGITRC